MISEAIHTMLLGKGGGGGYTLHWHYPPLHLPPTQAANPSPLETACAGAWGQEPAVTAVVLGQGSARCSHARRQVDLSRGCVSSPRSCATVFDLLVFGLAGQDVVSSTSPRGCVQAMEWAGRARRHPAHVSQAQQHPWSGWVGGHPWTHVALSSVHALLRDTGWEKGL